MNKRMEPEMNLGLYRGLQEVGFQKHKGQPAGCPHSKDHNVLECTLGSPYLWKPSFGARRRGFRYLRG